MTECGSHSEDIEPAYILTPLENLKVEEATQSEVIDNRLDVLTTELMEALREIEKCKNNYYISETQRTACEKELMRVRPILHEFDRLRQHNPCYNVIGFAKEILHGDENHRKWLLKAAEDYLAGKKVTAHE